MCWRPKVADCTLKCSQSTFTQAELMTVPLVSRLPAAFQLVQQLMQNTRLQTSAHWWLHLNKESTRSARLKREKTGEEVRSHLSIKLINKGSYLTAHVRASIPYTLVPYWDTWSCFKTLLSVLSSPLFQIGALWASRNNTYSILVTVLRHHQRFMYDYGVIMIYCM